MSANYNFIKVSLGIGLTWACAFVFSYGLSHATLNHQPLIFPTFQGGNFWFFIAAPIAQSALYIVARKVSWLLNIYVAISALCFAVFLYDLRTDGGYRFTYWHQGDYECLHGCNDHWIFGWLVFLLGCTLVFTSSAFDDASGLWRAGLRVGLAALLLGLPDVFPFYDRVADFGARFRDVSKWPISDVPERKSAIWGADGRL